MFKNELEVKNTQIIKMRSKLYVVKKLNLKFDHNIVSYILYNSKKFKGLKNSIHNKIIYLQNYLKIRIMCNSLYYYSLLEINKSII